MPVAEPGPDTSPHALDGAANDPFFALSEELLAVVTLDGQLLRVNPGWERVLGFSAAELLAYPWSDFVHPEDRLALKQARARLLATGALTDFEQRVRCRDGTYRWLSWRAILGSDGVTVSGIARDITARKVLPYSPHPTQLLDEMRVAVIATDLAGLITYWNAYATALYGWTPEEALGHPIGPLTVASIDPALREAIWAALRAGEGCAGKFLARRKDGSTFLAHVNNTPLCDEAGQLIGGIGVSVDIQEHYAVDLALRDSERDHRQLMEQAADAILILSDDGRFSWVNERARALTGYTHAELVSMHVRDIVPFEEASEILERIASIEAGPQLCERWIRRRDGQIISSEVSATRLTDGRVQVIIRDVSERRAMEAALRERDERFRLIARATNDAVWDWDVVRDRLWWNENAHTLLGYAPEQISPDAAWWDAQVHPDDRARVAESLQMALAGTEATWSEEYRFGRADGTFVTVLDRGGILRDAAGTPLRMLGSIQDITARQETEEALRAVHARERELRTEAEQRIAELEAVIDSLPDGVYIGDANGVTRANVAALRMLGYPSVAELNLDLGQIGERLQVRYADTGQPIPEEQAIFAFALQGQPCVREILVRDPESGEDRILRCAGAPVRVGGQIIGAVAVNTDITDHKQIEQALRASEANLAEAQRMAHLGSWELDHQQGTLHLSDELFRIMGYPPQAFQPTPEGILALIHPDDRGRMRGVLQSANVTGASTDLDFRLVRPDGTIRIVHQQAESLRDETGRLIKRIATVQDVTEQRALEAQLRHQAFHDPLTGLPNRTLFADRLGQALAHAHRVRKECAVCFVDLDRFKTINDSLGHAAGDQLLIAVAARLRGELREEDTLARLGGDEFAILLVEPVTLAAVEQVATRLLAALEPPVVVDGRDLQVLASIGIALSTPTASTSEDLLRFADLALYRAKAVGGAGWEVFSPALNGAALARLELEHDLRQAMERGEFHLAYQPQIDLRSGQSTALEALLRWTHPMRGAVSPDEFIPLAEEIGLIVPLGHFVLRQACRQLREWQERYPDVTAPHLAVNLSAREFRQPDLVAAVAAALADSGLLPGQLILEITETVAMEQLEESIVTLSALRALGVRLAIDDFGTGYSSLAYLQRLPVQCLKIDRAFSPEGERNRTIVQAVTTLAHGLGLAVTVEGLETAAQVAWARAVGCDHGQGYHFAPALTVTQAAALWERGLQYSLPEPFGPTNVATSGCAVTLL